MMSCIDPPATIAGGSGSFDARSLSCWLAITDAAGVPFVPATEIVIASSGVVDRLISGIATEADMVEVDRMADAMERLPTGWMVRHDHVGSEDLTIAAATGQLPEGGDDGVGWARWGTSMLPSFRERPLVQAMAP